jgi:tetratricopeptide (TPR) repeat protein
MHMKAAESMPQGEARDGLERLFERARALMDDPDTDVHIVELLSVYVKFEPHRGAAWFYLGDALRTVGRLQEAEEALLKAADLASGSNRFGAYARIGMLITKRGSPSDAEKWFRVATSEPSCPGWVWCLRGVNLLGSESYRLAKSCLETALISEDSVQEEVFLNLGLLERAQRRYEEARKHANDALAIDPNYVDAKRLLQSLVGIEETIEFAALAAEEATGTQSQD